MVILDEGERLPSSHPPKLFPDLKLLDITTEEEERDKIGIGLWMSRYSKLLRALFAKYVNTVARKTLVEEDFQVKDQ